MAALAMTIMVGFDGSASSRRALDRAADLAGYGSNVTVVSVSAPGTNGFEARLLLAAREQLAGRLILSQTMNPVGDAADELLAAATTLGADVLVIGAPLGAWANGSVAGKVVARASCDVLVVR
jgi:nucleotide-binding universal stress UspA family protein